jgi:hypothetical protein
MKAIMRTFGCLVFVAAFAVSAPPASALHEQPGEYEVKAAFLYNFLTFVEWPARARQGEVLRVCVMAEPPVYNAFRELEGQSAAGRKLTVLHPASTEDLGSCHVLFIGRRSERKLAQVIKALEGSGALTVGDTAGFAGQGVIINFYLEDNKVRFEVNAAAARRAGLTISSKLLKLAGAVHGAGPAGY